MAINQDTLLKITKYLDRLREQNRLRQMSVDEAMIDVRQWIPLHGVTDTDLRSVVFGYFLSHRLYTPADPQLFSPTSRASDLIDAVTKVVGPLISGVPIVDTTGGKVTIGVKGLTASMNGQGPKTALNVSWTGTLSTVLTGGNFTLVNTLSKDGWSISLSYPKDTPVLNSAKVGQVFGEAGNAVSSIIESTFGLTDVKDVRASVDPISSAVGPVADAMETAQGIAGRPKKGLSVNVSVGSPPPAAGQSGPRGGAAGFVTLTYSW